MAVPLINPLNKGMRALKTLQCPDHIQPNADESAYRVTSGAFIPATDGTISVDLEESLLNANLTVTSRYPHLPKAVALVGHTVAAYENEGYVVAHTKEPNNEHHGSITTAKKNGPLRKAARKMAEQAEFIVPIDPKKAVAFGAKPLRLA